LQTSGKELHFDKAYKSIHDFSDVEILDDDSSYSTELENEVDGDVNVTIENMSLQRLKELSESRNGIEITEVSEREVWFVQRSWTEIMEGFIVPESRCKTSIREFLFYEHSRTTRAG
jgi:hypothetical protein